MHWILKTHSLCGELKQFTCIDYRPLRNMKPIIIQSQVTVSVGRDLSFKWEIGQRRKKKYNNTPKTPKLLLQRRCFDYYAVRATIKHQVIGVRGL